jgi:hypothetical protein
MRHQRRLILAAVVVLACVSLLALGHVGGVTPATETLPARLSDGEFWELSRELSEPDGYFRSDNLVSNEHTFQYVVPALVRQVRPGGVYLGVAPDQNFTYIAATRPRMAFIVDVRRGNLLQHLMYKALIELSPDRADFVSRLFSRSRTPDLGPDDSVQGLFLRYRGLPASAGLLAETTALVHDRLLSARRFPLTRSDLDWIGRALRAFHDQGPEIHFQGPRSADSVRPSYRQLMTARDTSGQNRSYLATEDGFSFLKDLHSRNMIVPLVGDFSGPSAIVRTGEYIREHRDALHAFYASNVRVYLSKQQIQAFCRNLASLPVSSGAWYIDSRNVRSFATQLGDCQ